MRVAEENGQTVNEDSEAYSILSTSGGETLPLKAAGAEKGTGYAPRFTKHRCAGEHRAFPLSPLVPPPSAFYQAVAGGISETSGLHRALPSPLDQTCHKPFGGGTVIATTAVRGDE